MAAAEPDVSEALRAVAARRDPEAFARLFRHFAPRLKRYLQSRGLDRQRAEELTQEVLLTVWERAGRFDPARASASTWIFTIARNKLIDMRRREERAPVPEQSEELALDEEVLLESTQSAERRERLARALAELPPEQAEVLRRFYLQGRSHGEVADALGLPLGTVKSRIRLALRRLRARLEEPEQG